MSIEVLEEGGPCHATSIARPSRQRLYPLHRAAPTAMSRPVGGITMRLTPSPEVSDVLAPSWYSRLVPPEADCQGVGEHQKVTTCGHHMSWRGVRCTDGLEPGRRGRSPREERAWEEPIKRRRSHPGSERRAAATTALVGLQSHGGLPTAGVDGVACELGVTQRTVFRWLE
jgi:hypothetical protein